MSSGPSWALGPISQWADTLLARLMAGVPGEDLPACEDGIVAGSVRRRCGAVHDLELVLLPIEDEAPDGPVDLFGDAVPDPGAERRRMSRLDRTLDYWIGLGFVQRGRLWGDRQRTLTCVSGNAVLKIELYLAYPTNFGNICMIRTGPKEFSRLLVTHWRKDGFLPDHFAHYQGDKAVPVSTVRGGHLWLKLPPDRPGGTMPPDEMVACRTEEAFFRTIKMPWIDPWDRTLERLADLRRELRVPGAEGSTPIPSSMQGGEPTGTAPGRQGAREIIAALRERDASERR